jgi:uncharacterized membrane protein YedE/YeeE
MRASREERTAAIQGSNPADVLHPQLPWYLAGPALGLCVVACRLLLNGRLGVTGGYSELVSKLRGRNASFDWRGWLLIGVLLGGTLFALIAGGPDFRGYGWLTESFADAAVAPILVAAGVLIGYGAKLAGGCTSGNGLSGNAMLSPAAFAATGTFFATAIAVSFLTEALF